MMNDRDVEEHMKEIVTAVRRFEYFWPNALDCSNVEETNNGICIDWRMNDGQGAAIEMSYGPGDTYIKTEIRTFGNGPECTFIKTYDTNHPLDIYQCVEIVYEAMKNLSTINNDTQIWNLTCANKEYQHIRQ